MFYISKEVIMSHLIVELGSHDQFTEERHCL